MDWKDCSLDSAMRAHLLVSQMTLEEKVSQMTYFSSALSRFGIPEYSWWNEALHGVARAGTATVFPQAIGMAASFNVPLMKETAAIIGQEARIKHRGAAMWEDRSIYKGLTMWSPNVNIFRDPRWGRGHETYGEDPFLTSRMGVAFIQGLQGEEGDRAQCDATAKHFAVHSGPESMRHTFDAVASPKDMALTYLPAFRSAVEEGHVHAFMGAYNRVNGEAACASPTLLEKKLRHEWGFDGYVVSDCGAVEDLYKNHKVAADEAEAAALAVNNGCDLCCGWVFPHLLEAVKRGLISEETITHSVERLMRARIRLGLLDPEPPVTPEEYARVDSPEHHQKALAMARASMVLLKNDGLLPLNKDSIQSIAVIGPNADSRLALMGNYAGTPGKTYTILEGLQALLPDKRIYYAEGCAISGGSVEAGWGEPDSYRIGEALQAASLADAIVVVTGLNGEMESEDSSDAIGSGDKLDLELPESQRNLMKALCTLGKPMTLVNMTGSACVIPCEEAFGAIIQAWYPGQMGGLAVAELLMGQYAPSGRLPVTFYASTDQLPPFEDYAMAGRTYRYFEGECAYPFGFGLSYNRYGYKDLEAVRDAEGIRAWVSVTNQGTMPGEETVQAYISWVNPASAMPIRQLAAVEKVLLQPGETRRVGLFIPEKELRVCDDAGVFHHHGRDIRLYVGGTQPDAVSVSKVGSAPLDMLVKEDIRA